ncbi:hypothetical protein [Alkalicoccus urumqiensis]|nr:hypothetical protein [Alkalicoccus urumqiensis]
MTATFVMHGVRLMMTGVLGFAAVSLVFYQGVEFVHALWDMFRSH